MIDKCKHYSTYKAKQRPRCGCTACRDMYIDALLEENKLLQADRDVWRNDAIAQRRRADANGNKSFELHGDNSKLRDALLEYGAHEDDCLAGQGHQGRPTPGGYEHLFGYGQEAKWYPTGTHPECTCGLDAALAGKE